MSNNYARGKVYRIVCRKTGLQYFGSTTEPTLARRLAGHRDSFKNWKKGKYQFTTSFTILEENDYYIELVEIVPCSSKDELLVRERFHIQNNECVNKYIPLRTSKEYCEDNKEKTKEYYYTHREHLLEKMKEYRQANKEQIAKNFKEKYDCLCGLTICKYKKTRHEKSKKHQNYLKNQLENAEKLLEKNNTIENEDL